MYTVRIACYVHAKQMELPGARDTIQMFRNCTTDFVSVMTSPVSACSSRRFLGKYK